MLTLIIGGARSGKSDLAARLAAASRRPVLVLATMSPGDDEMRERIEAHRAARPAEWRTVEEPLRVVEALAAGADYRDTALIDCMTLWMSNLLIDGVPDAAHAAADAFAAAVERAVAEACALTEWAQARAGETIVVSNEVGLGVVPAYPLGRVFRDALGGANRAVAARADRIYATVAGLALELRSLGGVSIEQVAPPPA